MCRSSADVTDYGTGYRTLVGFDTIVCVAPPLRVSLKDQAIIVPVDGWCACSARANLSSTLSGYLALYVNEVRADGSDGSSVRSTVTSVITSRCEVSGGMYVRAGSMLQLVAYTPDARHFIGDAEGDTYNLRVALL
jgi:hypothetical protein